MRTRSIEGPDAAGQPRDVERWNAVALHRDALLRIARRRTASEEDAEDVVQEALVRAMEASGIDDERLAAWLTSVTVRLCVDTHRNRIREMRRWVRMPIPPDVVPFDERVCDEAEAAWAAGEVSRLPARQVTALRLRADGLTVGEVAQRLGVNYRTAESLLARARITMKVAVASTFGLAIAWWRSIQALRLAPVSAGLSTAAAAAALTVVAVTTPMWGSAKPNSPVPVVLSAATPKGDPTSPSRSASQPVPARTAKPTSTETSATSAPIRPSTGAVRSREPVGATGSVAQPPAVPPLPAAQLQTPAVPTAGVSVPSAPAGTRAEAECGGHLYRLVRTEAYAPCAEGF